jgi:hypothetical protein
MSLSRNRWLATQSGGPAVLLSRSVRTPKLGPIRSDRLAAAILASVRNVGFLAVGASASARAGMYLVGHEETAG